MATSTLFFDLDDTLMADAAASAAAAYATAQVAHGVAPEALVRAIERHTERLWSIAPIADYCERIGISAWECMWGHFAGDDVNLRALAAWVPHYRATAWTHALGDCGVHDEQMAATLAETFMRERRARQIVYDEVEATLRELGQRYTLGLITNGAPDVQREKIDCSGLAPYFAVLLVSGEVGVGKPDPQIFTQALAHVAATPAEALMVGDNLDRDVRGAQAVGMRGIWINRAGHRRGADYAPDAEIRDLRQLAALL